MKKLFILCLIGAAIFYAYQHYGLTSIFKSDEVILFIGDNCPPCDEAVDYLDEKGIEFTLCNISESDDNMNKFRRLGGRVFPLFILGDERIEGFDRALLNIAFNTDIGPDKQSDEVIMYMTTQCGWCLKASDYFKEHNIDVIEIDIDESYENTAEFNDLNGNGTPLIFIGSNRVDGFNKKAIEMALKQVGLM
jgi:glutaredoxin